MDVSKGPLGAYMTHEFCDFHHDSEIWKDREYYTGQSSLVYKASKKDIERPYTMKYTNNPSLEDVKARRNQGLWVSYSGVQDHGLRSQENQRESKHQGHESMYYCKQMVLRIWERAVIQGPSGWFSIMPSTSDIL